MTADTTPTLDDIAMASGTDKSSLGHGYCKYYERHLSNFPDGTHLIEIGHRDGQSFDMWQKWKPKWLVTTIDNSPTSNPVVSSDAADVQAVMSVRGVRPGIVIDDGSHHARDVARAFRAWLPMIKPNGVYVIEDLHVMYFDSPEWTTRHVSHHEVMKSLFDEVMEYGAGLNGKRICPTTPVEMQIYKSIAFIVKGNYSDLSKSDV